MDEQELSEYLAIQAETTSLARETANYLPDDVAHFALDGAIEVGEPYAALQTCWDMIDDDELVVPSELVQKVRRFLEKNEPNPDPVFLEILDDAAARAAAAA